MLLLSNVDKRGTYMRFSLLKYLDNEQIYWIFAASNEQNLTANTTIIEKNTDIDSIYFILKGLLHIYPFSNHDKPGIIFGARRNYW